MDAVKDWFGVTPDDWQGDLLEGLFLDKDRDAIKSAHGTGKSAVDAWAGWIFLNGYEGARLVGTAPTFSQLHDVLIPEFSKWHGKMPERMKNEWMISGGHIRHKLAPYEWFGVMRTSNKPANLQGFHGQNIFIIGDEGSAIEDPVFEVMEGTLSEAGDEGKTAKLLLTGNPNFAQGELYRAFNRNSDLYHCITVTGDPEWFESLGIKQGDIVTGHGRVYLSARVKKRYVDTMAKKYGKDSAVFDVRVRGIFPRAAEDCIFPWEWVSRAQISREEFHQRYKFDNQVDLVTIVVDPSRGGAAETVVGTFRKGLCLELNAKKTTANPQIVHMVNDAIIKLIAQGQKLLEIIVDEPGMGGGVIDDLRALGLPVRPYNGGWKLTKGIDPEDDCRQFYNRRARDHWLVRRKLELNQLPLPVDETLVAQMTSLRYKYAPGEEKILAESKEDLKDRLGKDASPDHSDVIVMGTAPWYESAAVHGQLSEEDIISGTDRPAYDDPDSSGYDPFM